MATVITVRSSFELIIGVSYQGMSVSKSNLECGSCRLPTKVPVSENPATLVVGIAAVLREGIRANDGGRCHGHNAEKANHLQYTVGCMCSMFDFFWGGGGEDAG